MNCYEFATCIQDLPDIYSTDDVELYFEVKEQKLDPAMFFLLVNIWTNLNYMKFCFEHHNIIVKEYTSRFVP
jgi:hypothetical protein